MATQGVAPATQPNQNGFIVRVRPPGGFADSWSQPNRIIATLAPMMPMSAETLSIPEYSAIRTTMIVALKEYSTHRKRLIPARRSRS